MPFDHSKIINTNTEFMVALDGAEDQCYKVPVNNEVRTLLVGMIKKTSYSISQLEDRGEIEYGEQYTASVRLSCKIDDPTVANIAELFNAKNPPSSSDAVSNPSCIDFYFARFYDQMQQTCLAVKTPAQFKVALGKKFLHLIDDELKVVKDDMFKLDEEFDFIVYDDGIEILKPVQFMRVAKVEEALKKIAPTHVIEISKKMTFVNFESILEFVEKRTRAQKLVSSIRKRTDLAQVSRDNLERVCRENNIVLIENNGLIQPKEGHEIDFLELLDGRRYPYPLDVPYPEMLRALSRKPAANPTRQ